MSEKLPYEVLKPIGEDGRKEVGAIVMLTEERAEAIGSDYVRAASKEQVKEAKATDLNKMSAVALKELCEKNGLVKTGSKADLIARLQEAGL